jgi:AcrR family transcriptional regulator
MSKSGLYAHFDSKESLQCQVLDAAADLFSRRVFAKAIKEPRGLPRIRALFVLWLDWSSRELSGGCPFVSAATEFDDRSGLVRDHVVRHLGTMLEAITRAARISVDEGHFPEDLDVDQFAFDFWSIVLSYHFYSRLMRRDDARMRASRAFEGLIERTASS